jgi:outer membrane protein TolC
MTGTDSETRDFGSHVDVLGEPVSSPQNSNDAALSLSWTLYDFGGRGARIRSARYLLDSAASTVGSTVQQTVFNVVQDYYGVVAGDAGIVAAKMTVDDAASSLEIVRALHMGGAATLGDMLQAEAAYDQTVLAGILANQTGESSHGTLAFEIGVPADQPLKLDAEPVPAEVPALTARIADLMAAAARQRPDLAAARSLVDSAVQDVTVARAAGRPSIAIAAARNRISTSSYITNEAGIEQRTDVPLQNYGQIGVTVTVPIFTGFSVGYGVRQAQATLEIREASAEQVRLQVTLDVWNGYYALDSANKQLVASATLLKTAQTNLEVAIGQYKSGVGLFLNLLTAQSALSQARQSRITAELNWEVARAQLAFALGRLSGTQPLAIGAPPP